jgi:putative multicomponent Na+:H+ antiporter subunit B
MLAITLYVVAVRSSLVMRIGVLEDKSSDADDDERHFGKLMDGLRTILSKHYMRLELVTYTNMQALHRALMDKEVHATCARPEDENQDDALHGNKKQPYHTTTRVRRIYDIMKTELSSPATILTYTSTPDSKEEQYK